MSHSLNTVILMVFNVKYNYSNTIIALCREKFLLQLESNLHKERPRSSKKLKTLLYIKRFGDTFVYSIWSDINMCWQIL
jgi:hypothetical protein